MNSKIYKKVNKIPVETGGIIQYTRIITKGSCALCQEGEKEDIYEKNIIHVAGSINGSSHPRRMRFRK